VPVAADPSRPAGRLLLDPAGSAVARFVESTRDGRSLADLLERTPGTTLDAAATAVLRDLRGWIAAGEPELGRALIDAGALGRRHAHVRSRDLVAHPAGPATPPPAGVRLGPLDRGAAELAELHVAAYPADHADWTYTPPPADPVADLALVLDGDVAGPVLDFSRLAFDAAGTPVGVLIVTSVPGEPPVAGPWVAELFRRPGPELRGTGRALLEAGLEAATAAGLPALGLAVSEGNPAERLYAALGFERRLSSLSVDVP
jgi:GNAT superfamily N-acetyltransferase